MGCWTVGRERRGGWYGDHDDFRSHQPFGGVARAAKVDLEKVDDEDAW